jgi:rod shape-determining protein MreD
MIKEKSLTNLIILHLIAILLTITNISDIKIAGIQKIMPLFDLMIIFYFSIFKNKFRVWFIFVLGIWNDALNGNLLGITSLTYIISIKIFLILNDRMILKENFIQVWRQFISFCLLFLIMKWAILSISQPGSYSLTTPLIQLIISSLFYVIMHKFFNYLTQKLLGEH